MLIIVILRVILLSATRMGVVVLVYFDDLGNLVMKLIFSKVLF